MTTPEPDDTRTDRIQRDLRRCASAEEYFELLGVRYDPRVLDVNRLHVLRRFAMEIEELQPADPSRSGAPLPPEQVIERYREALTRAYQAFVTGTALDHRLFKVLADRAPQAFVAAGDVRVHPPRTAP